MHSIPQTMKLSTEYTCIIDFESKKVITSNQHFFPHATTWVSNELQRNIELLPKLSSKTILSHSQLFLIEIETTKHIMSVLKKAMEKIIEPFPSSCIKEVYEESGKDDISVFMPDIFCCWWEKKYVSFISRFLKTQMFENFKMRKLMEIDAEQ